MNLFDFSEVDFSQPEVVSSLARAYAVLIEQAKRRVRQVPHPREERPTLHKEGENSVEQEVGVFEQLRLF